MKFELESRKINFSRRDVLFIIFFVLLLLFGVTAGRSLFNNFIKDYGETSKKETEIKILARKRQMLEEMEKTTIVDKARLMLRVFPTDGQAIKLVNATRVISQKHNVRIVRVSAAASPGKQSKKEENERAEVDEVALELSGPIQSFIPFLQEVEQTFPFSQVKDGSLSVEKGVPELFVKIETYGRKLPKSLPHVNTAISELTREERDLLAKLEEMANRQPVSPSFGSFPTGPVTEHLPGRSNPFSL